jgi:D-sedoheptulose 7-phosphate isomerase
MRQTAQKYFSNFLMVMDSIQVMDKHQNHFPLDQGIEMAGNLVLSQTQAGCKIIFIGNGASAAISSHMATDFWKNGRMRAIAFNDGSLLTCISNDFGYQYVFAKPIEMFAENGDILLAISSSGQSPNILQGIQSARSKQCKVITLSGFSPQNPLFSMGDINFYVPSSEYGPVEIAHQFICHCLLDIIMQYKKEIMGKGTVQ